MTIRHHDPAAEAAALVGDTTLALVLEPSPPAVHDGSNFADDPAAVPVETTRPTVGPTSAADRTWLEVFAVRPDLGDWLSTRWLANYAPLGPTPDDYAHSRRGFHRLAYAVVAEARRSANTRFGLRYTRGGYGTPFFADNEQVRVEDGHLVVQSGANIRSTAITTLRAAADFVGVAPGTSAAEHDSPPLGDLDEDLGTTIETGIFLGQWFGFSWAVLEELRSTPGAVDAERTQLWPGHFDPALAIGDADAGRATYGCSPGDDSHDEPYLYVGAWNDVDPDDPYWNEESFNGASLPYSTLVDSEDAVPTAISFFRDGLSRLNR